MADILVTGQEAYFNEDAKFFKDVYVYGNLYALGQGGVGGVGGGNFSGSVVIPENLFVGGISTFVGKANFLSDVNIENLQVGILTVTKKFDVGVGGTVLTASIATGNIGIGTSIPREKVDIIGTTLISDKLGIGNNSPQQALDVTGTALISSRLGIGNNSPQESLDVSGSALISSRLGIGNNSPQQALDVTGIALISSRLGIGNNSPQYPLDVTGDARISSQLYDSTNSSGVIGAFLTKDAQGIKWTPFEPSFVEGIFVYNEDVLVSVSSFRGLNLKKGRGSGITTDPIQGFVNPTSPSIADVYVYDYWDNVEGTTTIYRNSYVGIGGSTPKFDLDVFGSVGISSLLIVGGATSLSSTLDVTGITTLRSQLIVKGPTNLEKTLDVTGITTLRSQLIVKGPTNLEQTLDVTGITTLRSQLIVKGPTNLEKTLDVTGITTLRDQLIVGGATSLASTLDVTGITTLRDQLIVGGATSLASTLDVTGITNLKDQLIVGGATSLSSTLDVTGITTLRDQLIVGGATSLASTLDVTGITNLKDQLIVGGATSLASTLDVTGITTLRNQLIVKGPTILEQTLDVTGITTLRDQLIVKGPTILEQTLDVTGITTLRDQLIVGGATSLASTLDVTGITNLKDQLIVGGATSLASTLDVTGITTLRNQLIVKGTTNLEQTLDVIGITNLKDQLIVGGATSLASTLDVTGITTLRNQLIVDGATSLNSTLQVGVGGTVITTTGIGSVGIGTYNPEFDIDLANSVKFRKAIIDKNNKVGYDTNFYQTPRSVLTQVGIDTAGEIIGGRFFDAANMIRLNLDYIASEAVGYITSTDYKNPAFTLNSGDYTSCKDDIKDILKAITIDITKGGNVQSVGAGRAYHDGNTLFSIGITTTIATIGAAATVTKYVINNVSPPKSYQSGVGSIRQVRDLTLQEDNGSNTNSTGCSNVVSAIYTCAGIVTTIIGNGPNAVPINNPDGKVIWAPAGADSRNLIWVSKYGNDDNGGKTEGDAKLTIGAACEIAEPGDTVMVRSGVYYENNPIGLRTDVSVSGQDLRLVTVVPKNLGKDVFHVRRGCLIENMNFACETGESNIGGGALAFPPTTIDILAGKSYGAVTGYTAPGPANEGPSGRWRSPYVRNCTNFMPFSIGMKIDGDHSVSSTIGADLKCMVCDSFTQYNEAGIGVSITNNGYAQLVSIFTINCDKAIYVDTGGQCDLTNSNSSFGNYGLYAVGLGRTEFTAKVNTSTSAEEDTIVFKEVTDGTQVRRPYDGQALWFKINLANYNTGQTGIITAPLQQLNKINIINTIPGYSPSAPPDVTIYDYNTNSENPLGPEGIIAELSPTISDAGELIAVDVIGSGRNYLPSQDMRVRINGVPTNNLVAVMEPIYYTVSEATPPTNSGITTVTLNEFVPYLVYAEDAIDMRRISRILTSSHSFEYIGTGTDINTSTPLKGAVPIKENEIVALDGAQIPYTSTDQKGNFNIGEGIQVDQTTATIRGRDFSKAIQAQVTPLILALR